VELWESRFREPGGVDKLVQVLKKAGFTKADHTDLDNRITPYASYPQGLPADVWALLGYVAEGAFSMERLPAYTPKRSVDSIVVVYRNSESGHHIYLKKAATSWLRTVKKIRKITYEQPYYGGRSDVSSADGIWSIECGCTRPDKIWNTFRHEGAINQKIVLFNTNGITIFGAGKANAEYIKVEAAHRSEISKRIGERMRQSRGLFGISPAPAPGASSLPADKPFSARIRDPR
jgi:hypothetical protein